MEIRRVEGEYRLRVFKRKTVKVKVQANKAMAMIFALLREAKLEGGAYQWEVGGPWDSAGTSIKGAVDSCAAPNRVRLFLKYHEREGGAFFGELQVLRKMSQDHSVLARLQRAVDRLNERGWSGDHKEKSVVVVVGVFEMTVPAPKSPLTFQYLPRLAQRPAEPPPSPLYEAAVRLIKRRNELFQEKNAWGEILKARALYESPKQLGASRCLVARKIQEIDANLKMIFDFYNEINPGLSRAEKLKLFLV